MRSIFPKSGITIIYKPRYIPVTNSPITGPEVIEFCKLIVKIGDKVVSPVFIRSIVDGPKPAGREDKLNKTSNTPNSALVLWTFLYSYIAIKTPITASAI